MKKRIKTWGLLLLVAVGIASSIFVGMQEPQPIAQERINMEKTISVLP